MCAHKANAALVLEKAMERVSLLHSSVLFLFLCPAQISTTISPSTMTHKEDPISSYLLKL